MTYSKYYLQQPKRVPVLISLAVIALVIIFLTGIFKSASAPSKASNKTVRRLGIVNPSPNQVGLFWQTDFAETGWIVYGSDPNSLNALALDDRDLQDKKNAYFNHMVTVKDLAAGSKYYYKVVSNNELVSDNSAGQGKPFLLQTPQHLSLGANPNPAYGKIIQENGSPADNASVILQTEDTFPLAALSKTTGEWLIPLNILLNKQTLKSQNLKPEDKFQLEVFGENQKKSLITVDSANLSPLPQTIILGRNYSFITGNDVLSANTAKVSTDQSVAILFPKEKAVIPGVRPLIKGTAIPGNEIDITLVAVNKYLYKIKTGADGVWNIVITENLSPGSYSLNLKTKDKNGKTVELNRKFSIAKSGEQIMGISTPEATPTFTVTPTTPLLPTVSPTVSYLPSVTVQPSVPTTTPPTTGNDILPVGIASASLIILGAGLLIIF